MEILTYSCGLEHYFRLIGPEKIPVQPGAALAERDRLQPRKLATAATDLGVTAAGSRSAGAMQDEKGTAPVAVGYVLMGAGWESGHSA